jgi:hypothetical protein
MLGVWLSRACFYYRKKNVPFHTPHPSKGTFCTTTIVRKKRGGEMTSLSMTSLPIMTKLLVTWLLVTSFPVAHLSQFMMAYRSSIQSSTDQASNIPPQPPPPPRPPPQYSQSNEEEPYYIWKPIIRFFCFGNLYTEMYFI